MANRDFVKKPLYRKVNRRTHSLSPHDQAGPEYRWTRNAKAKTRTLAEIGTLTKPHYNGLDFTPLFKFLLSRVDKDWNPTYSEAVSRLPAPVGGARRDEPVFWMVYDPEIDVHSENWLRHSSHPAGITRLGENALYSALCVDDNGVLQKVAPDIGIERISPFCPCHTHTFNGAVVKNPCRNPAFVLHPNAGEVDQPIWQGFVR